MCWFFQVRVTGISVCAILTWFCGPGVAAESLVCVTPGNHVQCRSSVRGHVLLSYVGWA